ncbi:hypothetical protein E3E14_01960 [Streptomyces sp. ICN441]|nr:hypothetical protein E3E14_01960 [Streptomyces sp. ICN441]
MRLAPRARLRGRATRRRAARDLRPRDPAAAGAGRGGVTIRIRARRCGAGPRPGLVARPR